MLSIRPNWINVIENLVGNFRWNTTSNYLYPIMFNYLASRLSTYYFRRSNR